MTRHRDGPATQDPDRSPEIVLGSDPVPLRRDIVTIGASAGGVEALIGLFEKLPAGLPAAIAVVLHRHATHSSQLVEVLNRRSSLVVLEPEDGEPIAYGHIYLAPRGRHLLMEPTCLRVDAGPKRHRTRPAVDPLFESAARAFGPRVAGVLLSGGGSDGVDGLIAISRAGGVSLAQDPAEARNPSMPTHAIMEDDVDAVLPLVGLANAVVMLATEGVIERGKPLPRCRHHPPELS